ncbi:hypothetical protein [Deinococcus hopiensis]|uniref:hypothetical protein n=1 Tax=Deinococcus hopiensis TaxID=309885 RepID=UPI00111C5EF0|nr:hypothetical protein [Deinococcus hopiensis]
MRLKEGNVLRLRCHTGHAYTAISLPGEGRASVEASLWNAARTLDEDVMLLEHLAKHHEEAGQTEYAHAYQEEAKEAREREARPARRPTKGADRAGQDRLLNLTHEKEFRSRGT